MITKETIDRIFDVVRIEEIVGDFVQLKKRGVNHIGLCPFHNEKTPSFNVSPVRNIYKCFGCGKGGNAVNFIMEHEHYTYPEALRYIAGKYSIEIEESVPDPKELAFPPALAPFVPLNSTKLISRFNRHCQLMPASLIPYFTFLSLAIALKFSILKGG